MDVIAPVAPPAASPPGMPASTDAAPEDGFAAVLARAGLGATGGLASGEQAAARASAGPRRAPPAMAATAPAEPAGDAAPEMPGLPIVPAALPAGTVPYREAVTGADAQAEAAGTPATRPAAAPQDETVAVPAIGAAVLPAPIVATPLDDLAPAGSGPVSPPEATTTGPAPAANGKESCPTGAAVARGPVPPRLQPGEDATGTAPAEAQEAPAPPADTAASFTVAPGMARRPSAHSPGAPRSAAHAEVAAERRTDPPPPAAPPQAATDARAPAFAGIAPSPAPAKPRPAGATAHRAEGEAPSPAALAADAPPPARTAATENSPPAATARPPAPTLPPARQVTPVLVAVAIGGGTARLSVTLEPAELGRVEISVERSGDAAQVQILAERPETLALLQRDQRELDRALNQAGIATEGRSVALGLAQQDGGHGRQGRRDACPGRRRPAGDPAAEPAQRRAVLSLLDLAV